MKTKKSQSGSAISWFVATILVFFILILFVSFSTMKDFSKRLNNEKPEIRTIQTDIFDKLEQQRELQVFYWTETNNKTNREILLRYAFNNQISNQQSFFESYTQHIIERHNLSGCYFISTYKNKGNLIETSNKIEYGTIEKSDSIYSNDWKQKYANLQLGIIQNCSEREND